jgi:hypothetical protein
MDDIDMYELKLRGPQNKTEELRIELCDKINALGIGAQGLGGLTTVLDVKIMMHPTHAASKPVAMIPNCAATRHAHFVLDGSGAAYIEPPALSTWPDVHWTPDTERSRRVDLNTLTKEEVASWTPGQTLLLNGKMLTGRDAAHKRIQEMLARGESLPVDFTNRVIYYVGPVDPVRDEAGKDRADRHDRQGRTGTCRHRVDPETPVGLPDGGRRRGLPGLESDQERQGTGLCGHGHGSDLRVRRRRHAGDCCRRFEGNLGAQHRAERVGGED